MEFSTRDTVTRRCIVYTIIDNDVPEIMEDFLILLNSPLQEVTFQPSDTIQVFITDEDRKWFMIVKQLRFSSYTVHTSIVTLNHRFCSSSAFSVGFELGVYNIHEAVGFQTVCISLSGDLDGSNVTITVMSSIDGATALGKLWITIHLYSSITRSSQIYFYAEGIGLDFDPVSEVLLFTTEGEQCINVTVNNDGILEDEESFFLVLNTSDPRAFMFSQWAVVNILDNDSTLSSTQPCNRLHTHTH